MSGKFNRSTIIYRQLSNCLSIDRHASIYLYIYLSIYLSIMTSCDHQLLVTSYVQMLGISSLNNSNKIMLLISLILRLVKVFSQVVQQTWRQCILNLMTPHTDTQIKSNKKNLKKQTKKPHSTGLKKLNFLFCLSCLYHLDVLK